MNATIVAHTSLAAPAVRPHQRFAKRVSGLTASWRPGLHGKSQWAVEAISGRNAGAVCLRMGGARALAHCFECRRADDAGAPGRRPTDARRVRRGEATGNGDRDASIMANLGTVAARAGSDRA